MHLHVRLFGHGRVDRYQERVASGGGGGNPMWMPSAPPTLGHLLAWHPQPIPVFPGLCLLAAVFYGAGVIRLRRRGDAWPIGRTVSFGLGLLLALAVTGTGIGGYAWNC